MQISLRVSPSPPSAYILLDVIKFMKAFSQGRRATNDDDDEFDPHQRPKRKQKSILNTSLEIPAAEVGRTGLHILDEYHDHLLPTTLDPNASFLSGLDISSSQIDGGLILNPSALMKIDLIISTWVLVILVMILLEN